jgi:hypothetical protein
MNYGLIATVINIMMYAVFFFYFIKLKDKPFGVLGIQYILFSLIIGFQADALAGWDYPILIIFYAGITLALTRKQNP